MLKSKTTRPHRKCPCGSKKKYRNCCGKKTKINLEDLPIETQASIRAAHAKHQLEKSYHTQHYGYSPKIHSAVIGGKRIILADGSLLASDNPDKDWANPAQFFCSYLKTSLGNEWFDKEAEKPRREKHVILQWAEDAKYEIIDPNKPVETCRFNGSALAYCHLAYDFWVVRDHNYLMDNLIKRLKIGSSFNGARYELFTLATMIRAGFKLEPFDETLGMGRVTECRAIHAETQETIQVEAKTRNVKGVLGSPQGKQKNIDLYGKLRDAIEKNVQEPYVVFVDINLPELNVLTDHNKLKKVRKECETLERNFPESLPNIICFTNFPFHYGKEGKVNNSSFGLHIPHSPRVKLKNEAKILNALEQALNKYKYLPSEFEESKKFSERAFQ